MVLRDNVYTFIILSVQILSSPGDAWVDSNGIVMQAINQTVTKAFHKECLFTFCRGVNEVDCIESLMIAYE